MSNNTETDFVKLIHDATKPNNKLSIDTNGKLCVKKTSIFRSLFPKKKLIIENLNHNNKEICTALKKMYYSENNSDVEASLKFQKQINKITGKKLATLDFITEITKSWMTDLPDSTKKLKLNELTLIGTHDSGAYQLAKNVKDKSFIGRLTAFILSIPIVKSVIENVALTQNKSIHQQLNAGVRQLDLRLAVGEDNQIYISHTFKTVQLEEALKEIKDFMDKNPKEIVVINVKPDYPHRKGFDVSDNIIKTQELFKTHFSQMILSPDQEMGTVGEMQETGKRVVLYANDVLRREQPNQDNAIFRTGDNEVWPETPNIDKVIGKIKEYYQKKEEKKEKYEYEYISFNSTPDVGATVKNILTNNTLQDSGKKIQKSKLAELGDTIEKHKPAAVMFDAPKKSTVQWLIRENNKRSSEKNNTGKSI